MNEQIQELETIIRHMATASSHLCSIMVQVEVIKSIPNHEHAKDLMSAISRLHELCAQDKVKEIFSNSVDGNGKDDGSY